MHALHIMFAGTGLALGALAFALQPTRQLIPVQQPPTVRPAAPIPKEWTGKPPLVTFSGSFSAERVRGITRPADQASWRDVWTRHQGERAEKDSFGEVIAPEIDWTNCMAVAIFEGLARNNRGLYVVGIEDQPERVLLRYDGRTYQTASFGDQPDRGNTVTPYGLFILPRSSKTLVIEENTQNLLGQPPIWTERARFDGV
ncbi:MAG: hypothetical protein JNK25_09335 [Phycisphaerae bacterium]|nr:hypothetical protein [Phycisphaerae bacterium]